jgi:subtilisin-like proprotein convertase family protein
MMKKTNKSIGGAARVVVCAAVIFSLLAVWAFRQNAVSAQGRENNVSPQANEVTFTSTTPIVINDNGNASPYPSNIVVNDPALTTVTKVQVKLFNFTHTFPDDVDIVLVGPGGRRAMVMSDAGGGTDVNNLIMTFDPTSANILPDETALSTGTTRPANYVNVIGTATDNFPAPGPGLLTNEPADLSVFNLTNPNGTWSLYVVDDAVQDVGQIGQGWDLILTVPQIFTVTNTNDSGAGSLRDAITQAQDGDLINFSAAFNTPQTINLLTALPDISRSITIVGPGANLLTVQRAFNAMTDFRIFTIPFGVPQVDIRGVTISNGRAGSGIFGGGINSQGNLILTNVHVTGNQADTGGGVGLAFSDGVFTGCTFSGNTSTNAAGGGGGIFFQGDGGHTLRVVNSTISGNSSVNRAGGIDNASFSGNSRLEVVNSTIANNTAGNGGGIETFTEGAGTTATTTLRNTIVANNSPNNLATGTAGGGAATFTTNGFNLSDNYNDVFTPAATDITTATPRLGPLSPGGGQTPTHALLHGSPAIDAGDASGFSTDQRGQPRLLLPGTADIGSVEMRPLIVSNTNDAGVGSLRQAIVTANSVPDLNDILFDNTVFNTAQTITLTTGELSINSDVTINGPGANLLTVSGNNNSRVFFIASGFAATLSGMTITGGNGVGAGISGFGGGIHNLLGNLTISDSVISVNNASIGGGGISSIGGTFSLNRSTVSGNTAASIGGGLNLQNGNAALTNSTISGNTANDSIDAGGGVFFFSGGGNFTLQATSCTIANNTTGTPNTGGGIMTSRNAPTDAATVLLRNTIIANNSLPNLRTRTGNQAAAITSQGFNLANDDGGGFLNPTGITTDKINAFAGLAPLGLNGGTTPTHALLFGSNALDAGNNSGSGVLTDQRGTGFNRTVELPATNAADGTDIGAFEAQTAPDNPPTAAATAANVTTAGGTTYTFTVTYSDDLGLNVSSIINNNAAVRVTGPNGFNAAATYVSIDIPTNGTPRIATYSITPPGGSWDIGDNGAYNIVMQANQVFDTSGNAVAAGNIGSFTVNIAPTISINDVSMNEGTNDNTEFSFTVSLSAASGQTVTVNYATADGTATAPFDYLAVGATTLTFNPGETFKLVPVSVNGDTDVEPNETFFVNLSNPTNATISDNQGLGTIQNDDAGCSYSLNPTGNNSVPAAGVSSSFNVVTQGGCAWTSVSSNVQWITVTSGLSGSGNGTVNYCVSANGGPQRSGTISVAGQTFNITQLAGGTTTRRMAADFDGDNRSDLSIFRPSAGQWWYQQSSNNSVRAFGFGAGTDKIVPADYDGDGKIDIATFTPSTGTWSVLRSSNLTFFAAPFGTATDIPAPGDFDGDGKADFAIYRPSDTNWYINRTGSCGVLILQFGIATDIPVVGDYDGDGMADIAIFRPNGAGGNAEWWIRRSTAGLFATPFGTATDKPIPGDYTGDGKTDIAFFRPVSSPANNWFILRSDDITFFAAPFGLATDIPAPGDYDGDGKYDLGVFRPTDTNWFVLRSSNQSLFAQQFGATGDKPVAAAFIP